ncbi:putative cyclin-D7-1 [Dichanthelium oligosanthes]|uniref:Putative cyclin-D7-1 n=1 Tax=Dichanthelium oligosanthes TaxID=888268 RepID=A0A1E5VLF5_9POAL|nr:putative cyclin-D7-1 [Dichanthelium oligosanthes]
MTALLLLMMTPAPAICYPSRRLHQSSSEEKRKHNISRSFWWRTWLGRDAMRPAEATWTICYSSSRDDHQQQLLPPLFPMIPMVWPLLAREECTTSSMLGLSAATAFNAVNYLDRFLSINCHLRWEAWMVELMEEAMSHSFRASSVRDMELTLLKALQWRLACVTPYSFLQLLHPFLLGGAAATAAAAATRLLIRSLAEPSLLLRFDSYVIAASAVRCVSLQHQQQGRHGVSSSSDIISRLLIRHPHDHRPTAVCKHACMQTTYSIISIFNSHLRFCFFRKQSIMHDEFG